MSQRRSRKDEEQAAMISTEVSVEEVVGCLTLDDGKPSPTAEAPTAAPLSIDELYRHERLSAKRKHWKESPFAAGLVEITWRDEDCCCGAGGGRSGPSVAGLTSSEIDPDSSGCLWCSGLFCPRIGAGRVGNMAVLYQVQEWVEQVEEDEETGEKKTRRFTRPRLVWLMGPYWPMLLFVTYPLIFVVSLWTLATSIPRVSPIIQVVWAILTLGLIYALAMTAFRDPGILHRHTVAPPGLEQSWRWCDAAQTYRPRGAVYDPDCAVVVEDFDHTCPWTGTAIGKKNMPAFQCFVGLVFICLIFDILLLTGALS